MVGTKTVLHIVEILGVFFCAHHLWPKGVTYGKQEDWEKSYRKRHSHGASKSKSRRAKSGFSNDNAKHGGRSERSHQRQTEYQERPRQHYEEYQERPRTRNHGEYEEWPRNHYEEYEERPRQARQTSSRY